MRGPTRQRIDPTYVRLVEDDVERGHRVRIPTVEQQVLRGFETLLGASLQRHLAIGGVPHTPALGHRAWSARRGNGLWLRLRDGESRADEDRYRDNDGNNRGRPTGEQRAHRDIPF